MPRRRPDAAGDPLRRGVLVLRQHGVAVELVSGEGVFSAAAVDPGTAFLLRWIAGVDAARVLDLGCGYGPLGLWLAAADEGRAVLAVDRDAVALACTEAGAERNGLGERVRTRASLGYDDVDADAPFDLVVSNVPAKVGPSALRHLLLDSWFQLAPGGRVAVVVVSRLAPVVAELLAAEPAVVVDAHHANRGYGAWVFGFDGPPAGDPGPGFERGVYARGRAAFTAGRTRWEASTSFTVAEFDTLSHGTVAAVELLERRRLDPSAGPVAVLGPGQGHLPAALRAIGGPDLPLRLIDRDLLALRTSAANVPGVDSRHAAHPAGCLLGCAAAVAALPEKQPVSVTAELLAGALRDLGPGSPVVLHGRAADVSRVLDVLGQRGLRLAVRERRAHGSGAAAFAVTPPG